MASDEVKQDAKKIQENFHEFIRHSKEVEEKRLSKEKEIAGFWDNQGIQKQEDRQSRRKSDIDYQTAVQKRENFGELFNPILCMCLHVGIFDAIY